MGLASCSALSTLELWQAPCSCCPLLDNVDMHALLTSGIETLCLVVNSASAETSVRDWIETLPRGAGVLRTVECLTNKVIGRSV
jgi:hypothetical protein